MKETDVGHFGSIRKDIKKKKGSGSNPDAFPVSLCIYPINRKI